MPGLRLFFYCGRRSTAYVYAKLLMRLVSKMREVARMVKQIFKVNSRGFQRDKCRLWLHKNINPPALDLQFDNPEKIVGTSARLWISDIVEVLVILRVRAGSAGAVCVCVCVCSHGCEYTYIY